MEDNIRQYRDAQWKQKSAWLWQTNKDEIMKDAKLFEYNPIDLFNAIKKEHYYTKGGWRHTPGKRKLFIMKDSSHILGFQVQN